MKKKFIASLALFGLLLSLGLSSPVKASASTVEPTKPASTWQIWYGPLNILVVFIGDQFSSEGFRGMREDYSGFATSPAAPTSQYNQKLNAINSGLTYVDQEWLDYYTK